MSRCSFIGARAKNHEPISRLSPTHYGGTESRAVRQPRPKDKKLVMGIIPSSVEG